MPPSHLQLGRGFQIISRERRRVTRTSRRALAIVVWQNDIFPAIHFLRSGNPECASVFSDENPSLKRETIWHFASRNHCFLTRGRERESGRGRRHKSATISPDGRTAFSSRRFCRPGPPKTIFREEFRRRARDCGANRLHLVSSHLE